MDYHSFGEEKGGESDYNEDDFDDDWSDYVNEWEDSRNIEVESVKV